MSLFGDRLRDLALEVAHEPGRRGLQPRRDAGARRARRGRSSARRGAAGRAGRRAPTTAGPATMTARRLVGTANSSSCSLGGLRSRGSRTPRARRRRAVRAATGSTAHCRRSRRRAGRAPVRPRRRGCGCSAMSTRYCMRPKTNGTDTSTAAARVAPRKANSTQPKPHASTNDTTTAPSTSHPVVETTPGDGRREHGRPLRAAPRAGDRRERADAATERPAARNAMRACEGTPGRTCLGRHAAR